MSIYIPVAGKIRMLNGITPKVNGTAGLTFHSADPGPDGTANQYNVTPISEDLGTAEEYPVGSKQVRRVIKTRVKSADGSQMNITHAVLWDGHSSTDRPYLEIIDVTDKVIQSGEEYELTLTFTLPA